MVSKIAITGSNGMLGAHFVSSRLFQHFDVVPLARAPKIVIFSTSGDFIDYNNEAALRDALLGVDCVVHLAGLSRSSNQAMLKLSNEQLTSRLVEAANDCDVKHFCLLQFRLCKVPCRALWNFKIKL